MFGLAILFLILIVSPTTYTKPPTETLSREDVEHFMHDPARHDASFDHNAFLGSETAKEYSKLTPQESRDRLSALIKKIDTDRDGVVNATEMRKWIAHVAVTSQQQVTEKRWTEVNKKQLNPWPWADYIEMSYGKEEDRMKDPGSLEDYKKIVAQDRRRWMAADENKDDALSKEEFYNFLNPEEKPHMKDALIDELLDSVDTDKDGKVSETEYLQDLARAYQSPLVPGEPEPEWVEREREQYQKYRDSNHDGTMDRAEVGEWIMPSDYDPVEAEVQHLFYHADHDHDDMLTEKEILDKQDLFVSSQATNYGIALEQRDEL